MVKHAAHTWLRWFAAGFVIIVALLLVTLFTPAPYGDLTRIGRLSDADFGWQKPPPVVDKALVRSVPLNEADVLVIGDSFSMTLRWQTKLVAQGYRVATIYWGQVGYLCGDFSAWARQEGFRGKVVVIESVERLMSERLAHSEQCKIMLRGTKVKATPYMEPLEQMPGFGLNWSAKLTTGVITYANMRKARAATGDTVYSDETWVRPVPNGCSYFSHKLCDKALFFFEDLEKPKLQSQSADFMQRFDAANPQFRFIWMVVPDKTTVYIDPQRSADFRRSFNAAKLGPDLFSLAFEERGRTRDFYFPNDTHLSMHGQLILGERMLQAVREVLPAPGKAP